jgi:uncharacterized SAM-dependent methyltransferase
VKYFKNIELVKLYNVSDKAVRNWIVLSEQGKVNLKLCHENNKAYIADTLFNQRVIDELVAKGRKYRNKLSHRDITPKANFYKIFKAEHVIEILNSLEKNHELPWKFNYYDEGGKYWDKYLWKLYNAGGGNILTNTIETLQLNYGYLDKLLSSYKNINIINICIGNFLNARDLVAHIQKSGKLRRLIGIDISPEMLSISKRNIGQWFENKILLETYEKDIERFPFDEITTSDSFDSDASDTANIFLFLAGPIKNFKDTDQILRSFYESMGKHDLLITSLKRDTAQAREFFDFNIETDKKLFTVHDVLLPHLLSIDDSMYEWQQLFDPIKKYRRFQICLKTDISIHAEIGSYKKRVDLRKGDVIQTIKVEHFQDEDLIKKFRKANFKLQGYMQSLDGELSVLINKVRTPTDL